MANPLSGMKASRIVFRFCSSAGSSFPSFFIFCKRERWLVLKWEMNLAQNLEIQDVTILSRNPLTPAKITQTCYSATIGTYIIKIIRIAFALKAQLTEHLYLKAVEQQHLNLIQTEQRQRLLCTERAPILVYLQLASQP